MAAARRTLRTRLTVLYAASFLVCAAVLLAVAALPALTFSRTHAVGAASAASGTNLPQLLEYLAAALALLAVLAVALGRWVAGRALRPLLAIGTAARAISASDLHQRLRLDGSYQEFSELGTALDDLFGRLDAAFEAQRRFVANAAHELRTPLTAERTLLQVALADPQASTQTLRDTCAQLLELGGQQEQLIDALLTLAAGENGVDDWELVDLAQTARQVVDARRDEAGRRGIRVDARLAPAAVAGDPRLVTSMVANLVDNALRYNAPGGSIEVVVGSDADAATVSVANTGLPVPPDQIERLLQPFQRLSRQREHRSGGHGLGLAIVRTIATAHGATLSARANAGGGLTVAVRIRSGPAAGTPRPAGARR